MYTDMKEKELYLKIEKARKRYDWRAYDKHFRELCEYNYDKSRNDRR